MPTPYHFKTRNNFPASDGWIEVVNTHQSTFTVYIEPWAMSHELGPGESCHIHLVSSQNEISLNIEGTSLVAFCADAIYQNGTEIWDFSDPEA